METLQAGDESAARCGLKAADVYSLTPKDAPFILRGLTSSLSFLSLCFVNFSISHNRPDCLSAAARSQVSALLS